MLNHGRILRGRIHGWMVALEAGGIWPGTELLLGWLPLESVAAAGSKAAAMAAKGGHRLSPPALSFSLPPLRWLLQPQLPLPLPIFPSNRRRQCRSSHHGHQARARSRRGWLAVSNDGGSTSTRTAASTSPAADRDLRRLASPPARGDLRCLRDRIPHRHRRAPPRSPTRPPRRCVREGQGASRGDQGAASQLVEVLKECPGQYYRYHGDWRTETHAVVSMLAFMHWLETGGLLIEFWGVLP